jgi:hypothetical protein
MGEDEASQVLSYIKLLDINGVIPCCLNDSLLFGDSLLLLKCSLPELVHSLHDSLQQVLAHVGHVVLEADEVVIGLGS